MINCNIMKVDDRVKFISISGHAEFAEFGSDIVCAGVSMLAFTVANKITLIDKKFDLNTNEEEFVFTNNLNNHDVDLLLDTLYLGLKMVESEYGGYISIKEV